MPVTTATTIDRGSLMIHATKPVIKPNPSRKTMPDFDKEAYKNRNQIERMFNKMKQLRRIATRYDKSRCSFSAIINRAAIKVWLPTLVYTA